MTYSKKTPTPRNEPARLLDSLRKRDANAACNLIFSANGSNGGYDRPIKIHPDIVGTQIICIKQKNAVNYEMSRRFAE